MRGTIEVYPSKLKLGTSRLSGSLAEMTRLLVPGGGIAETTRGEALRCVALILSDVYDQDRDALDAAELLYTTTFVGYWMRKRGAVAPQIALFFDTFVARAELVRAGQMKFDATTLDKLERVMEQVIREVELECEERAEEVETMNLAHVSAKLASS